MYRPIALAFLLSTQFCVLTFADFGNPFAHSPEPVLFDVPALCPARPVPLAIANDETQPPIGILRPIPKIEDRVIEIVIPVSTRLTDTKKIAMNEFRFEIFWNRNIYPLVNYGPKTITGSPIEGLVSVEKRNDRNATLGLNLNSQFNSLVSGTATGQLQNKQGSLLKYQEIPKHEIFVASGTVQRGTGAFFRFHPTRISTLEGGRELVVAYRVPRKWRGGLVQVECFGKGKRKFFAGFSESISAKQSFVVPVFLEGDQEAQELAAEFVRAEQNLRRVWQEQANSGGKYFAEQDVSSLLQASENSQLKSIRRSLPTNVRTSIDNFLVAKRDLIQLGRTR